MMWRYFAFVLFSLSSCTLSLAQTGDDLPASKGACNGERCQLKPSCEQLELDEEQCEALLEQYDEAVVRGNTLDENKLIERAYDIGAKLPPNSEQLLPDQVFTLWTTDRATLKPAANDRVAPQADLKNKQRVRSFDEYLALDEPDKQAKVIDKLKLLLDELKIKKGMRLHFIGYTDNGLLSTEERARFGDHQTLSQIRAQEAADYFRRILNLPESSVSHEGRGTLDPIADNNTAQGRILNRRVEIQIWHDQTQDKATEAVVTDAETKRVKVCRVQERCIFRRKAGETQKIQMKNALPVFRYDTINFNIPKSYFDFYRMAFSTLQGRKNITLKFIGHSDGQALNDSLIALYQDKQGYSYAVAEKVARAVQEQFKLPNTAISIQALGDTDPVSDNQSASGRALNRRVEVELWYDAGHEASQSEPQLCPGDGDAEMVTLQYEDKPIIFFKNGKPEYPGGPKNFAKRVSSTLEKLLNKNNVRINFVGHTTNERLSRRAAMVYDTHQGLSESRAKRVLRFIQQELALSDKQVQFEGRGFLEPYKDSDSGSPFAQRIFMAQGDDLSKHSSPQDARVELEFLYDEPAVLEQDPNMEIIRVQQEEGPVSPYALHPIRITVDGEAVDHTRLHNADIQRCTDVALDSTNVQLRYDNLKSDKRLNVHAVPSTVAYVDDPDTQLIENIITFAAYTNYGAFIDRAEVRIFDIDQSLMTEPLSVVQLNQDLQGEWWWIPHVKPFEGPIRELKYLLRVYNNKGLFDETVPKRLWVVNQRKYEADALSLDQKSEQLAGYGESSLGLQNIPVYGGTVTVVGDQVPQNHQVWMMNQPVPIDKNGRFASEYILPDGLHSVELSILDGAGSGDVFLRDFQFRQSDWFVVAMADLTLGMDDTNGPARLVTQDEHHFNNDTFIDGHLAFYTKGKTKRNYIITASADTLEEPFENLFSNMMDKNPDAVFRRMDPDYFYPTYGDDSTVEEDAPTKGKFYIKAEKNKSYAMWGNFEAKIFAADLAQIDRSLYGAHGHYESMQTTEFGESTYNIDLFAAEPGTVQQRDEFRGTGGSLYFLRRRDITVGSDRIRIEIRDRDSGLVLEARNLVPNQDYDIDYIQGRILLAEPLPSTASSGLLVQDGSLSGNPVYLVVRYEHTPGFEEIEDVASGGRLSSWLGDHVQVGTTFSSQEQLGDEHNLLGADITIRATPSTYIKIENASSEGPGQNEIFSNDGGFQFNSITQDIDPNTSAGATRIEAAGNLSDLYEKLNGNITLYQEEREAGYSAPGQFTMQDLTLQGGSFRAPVHKKVDLYIKYDSREREQGLSTTAGEVDAYYRFNDHWRFSSGVRVDSREDRSIVVPVTQTQGDRTDLAVEARYDSLKSWTLFSYVQSTLEVTGSRENNDRVGVGGIYQITDRWKLDAEVSSGDGGSGARIGTDYLASDRTNLYFAYLLEPERDDTGYRGRNGRSVAGFRSRYSDSVSVYGEERYTFGDIPTGLTHAYGLDLAPTDKWLFGLSAELGTLEDHETAAKIDRTAYGLRVNYGAETVQLASAVEYREDVTDIATRETTLLKNTFNYQLTPNWRIVGKYNASDSVSSQGEFYDGNFTEMVFGYAYRPVDNDKINAIVKYTYFENLPSQDQLAAGATSTVRTDFIQKSHIYSFDIVYDWNARLSIGGKYAVRVGEVATDRTNPVFFESNANLVILRGDWHILKKWDVLTELRRHEVEQAQDSRSGLLIGVYRHFGDNIKAGIGYNFTDFSDDLTDLDYDSQGLFINVTGKL